MEINNYDELNKLYINAKSFIRDAEVFDYFKSNYNLISRPSFFSFSRTKMAKVFKTGYLALGLCVKSFANNNYTRLNVIFSPQDKVNYDSSILFDVKSKINDFANKCFFNKTSIKDKKLYNLLFDEEDLPKAFVLPDYLSCESIIYLSLLYIKNISDINYEDRIIPIIFNYSISKEIIELPQALIINSNK